MFKKVKTFIYRLINGLHNNHRFNSYNNNFNLRRTTTRIKHILSILDFKKIALVAVAIATVIYLPVQLLNQSKAVGDTPSISNLSEISGSTTGNTELEIIGENFFKEQDISIVQVSAGYTYSLAIDSVGNLYAWGSDSNGAIGDGISMINHSGNNVLAPIKLNGLDPGAGYTNAITSETKIVQVSAGRGHSLALDDAGNVYAWGNNSNGQIGNGDNGINYNYGSIIAPIKLNGLDPGASYTNAITSLTEIDQISAGGNHSLAVDNQGDIYAWGSDAEGQIGDGSSTANHSGDYVLAPIKLNSLTSGYTNAITSSTEIDQISAGYAHTLAQDKQGNIYTWGSDEYGQVGDGATTTNHSGNNVLAPIKLNGLDPGSGYTNAITSSIKISQISTGYFHSFAVDDQGNLYAWGINIYSQIGDGNSTVNHGSGTDNVFAPVKLNGLDPGSGYTNAITSSTKIVQASAGNSASLALDDRDNIYAWGTDFFGTVGDGDATTNHYGDDVKAPIKLNGLTSGYTNAITSSTEIVQVSTGENHSLALDDTGNLYAWGDDTSGQIGDGELTTNHSGNYVLAPIQINNLDTGATYINALNQTNITSNIASIKFGNKEVLDFTVNSDTSITVTTPPNNYGTVDVTITTLDNQVIVLPNAYTYTLPIPEISDINPDHGPVAGGTEVEITGLNFLYEHGVEIAQVVGGTNYSLALDTEGNIWGWGRNNYGQLGRTANSYANSTPTKLIIDAKFEKISAGYAHSLAIDTEGNIWSWGYNRSGQLGTEINNSTSNPNPTPTKLNISATFNDISTSNAHSLAIDTEGNIWSWGNNRYGQLGTTINNNTTDPNPTPTKLNIAATFDKISTGSQYSLALDNEGNIWSWGYNFSGELGTATNNNTEDPNPTPTKLTIAATFDNISAGSNHTLALDNEGNIWSWGYNYYGELGTAVNSGSTYPNPTPNKLTISATFNKISTGSSHSLAFDDEGNIWGWGYNYNGQLGTIINNNTPNDNPIPTKMTISANIDDISAGSDHSFAIDAEGNLWSFGYNNYGELGISTNVNTSNPNPTPTKVPVFETLDAISSITFDNVEVLSFTINSNTSITAITPPRLLAGTVDVGMTTLDNQEAVATNGYTYEYEGEPYINLSIDNSNLNIDITPNLSSNDGVTSSSKHTVSFTSNRPLVDLLLNTAEAHSNLINLTDNTKSVPSTDSTLTTPTTLNSNTWGFGVTNRILESNSSNSSTTWAKVPNINESPILIKSTTTSDPASETTPTDTDIFYGAKIDSTQLAGFYGTTVVYTAIEQI